MTSSPLVFNYEGLKALAQELGRPASTLFALAPQNDPFYVTPAQQAAAAWFAGLWQDHGAPGSHLRRIHYRLVSQTAIVRMLDGKAYENTEECWKGLCSASTAARHLGLVPADALVDRRNAEPLIYLDAGADTGADIRVAGANPGFALDITMPDLPRLALEPPQIEQR